MKFTAVIPARWASSRFPGKPLADVAGAPMVVRTAQRATLAETVGRVVVATDDTRICDVCRDYGFETVLTSPGNATGTDRVAEVGRILELTDVVNVQGDEPLISPAAIDAVVQGLVDDGAVLISNSACPLRDSEMNNPNVVKAVADLRGRLIYLTRHPAPYSWEQSHPRLRHLGLYAFRGAALENFTAREKGALERAERVEMYRFIEYGDPISLVQTEDVSPAVDTPEDLAKLEDYALENGGWARFYG